MLNPVRAKMVRKAESWPWSSYRSTIGIAAPTGGLYVDWILSISAKRKSTTIARYKEFISLGKNQPFSRESLTNQIFLGSDQFITKVRKHIPKDKDLSEVPQRQKRPIAKPLKYFSGKSKTRDLAIIHAFESGGYSMAAIV